MTSAKRLLASVLLCLAAGACTRGQPVATVPGPPEVPAAVRVEAIRQAGQARDDELDVRPLADPEVEGLREQARAAEQDGRLADAAAALDAALALRSEDPLLMQERAEIALLAGRADLAQQLARRALAVGARVGPLCRRHWATVEQALLMQAHGTDAAPVHALAQAREAAAACTVAAPARY